MTALLSNSLVWILSEGDGLSELPLVKCQVGPLCRGQSQEGNLPRRKGNTINQHRDRGDTRCVYKHSGSTGLASFTTSNPTLTQNGLFRNFPRQRWHFTKT